MTFGETMTVAIVTALLTSLIVGPSSAIATAWISLRRYKAEKWWEKKAAAYEGLIEDLYFLIEEDDRLLEYYITDRTTHPSSMEVITAGATKGRAEVYKRSRIGSFLLSDEAVKILDDLVVEYGKAIAMQDWVDSTEARLAASSAAYLKFAKAARDDLAISPLVPGRQWAETVAREAKIVVSEFGKEGVGAAAAKIRAVAARKTRSHKE